MVVPMEETKITDLDHQGAIIWVDCPLCGALCNMVCASVFCLGPDVIFCSPGPGKVHDMRMKKWLEFKARVVAGTKFSRGPNIQQVPRRVKPREDQ